MPLENEEQWMTTDPLVGLSEEEVRSRLEKYGANKLVGAKSRSLLERIFSQINNVLIYVLIVAAVISGLLGELVDSIIIGLVVVINAIVGVIQESKAEEALEALKSMATPKALVRRNGEQQEIPSEDVVPGDVIVLDAGRYVPCDIRLMESANLKIDEAALTGESVPVDKDAEFHWKSYIAHWRSEKHGVHVDAHNIWTCDRYCCRNGYGDRNWKSCRNAR